MISTQQSKKATCLFKKFTIIFPHKTQATESHTTTTRRGRNLI